MTWGWGRLCVGVMGDSRWPFIGDCNALLPGDACMCQARFSGLIVPQEIALEALKPVRQSEAE